MTDSPLQPISISKQRSAVISVSGMTNLMSGDADWLARPTGSGILMRPDPPMKSNVMLFEGWTGLQG